MFFRRQNGVLGAAKVTSVEETAQVVGSDSIHKVHLVRSDNGFGIRKRIHLPQEVTLLKGKMENDQPAVILCHPTNTKWVLWPEGRVV